MHDSSTTVNKRNNGQNPTEEEEPVRPFQGQGQEQPPQERQQEDQRAGKPDHRR
jgi:hypothetical protein